LLSVQIGKTLEGRALRIDQVVRDYPITLTVSVNGLLANFAVAFTAPTFGVFALLFTGAVLVKGRHTVTRMILAAGIRASHHARFHRFFSQSRWEMDVLWERLLRLLSAKLLSGSERIEVVIDETAQKKTGAKIYGAGMVYDNRPKSAKGRDLEWGLTWVVASVLVRVPSWKGRVFAVPVLSRLYRRKPLCRHGRVRFKTKGQLALEMIDKLAEWLPGRRIVLLVDGNYADHHLMLRLPKAVEVVSRVRHDAALWAPRPKGVQRIGRPRLHGRKLPRPADRVARQPKDWTPIQTPNGRRYEVQTWTALWWKVFGQRPIRIVATRRPGSRRRPEFFYTTDLTLSLEQTLAYYTDRWAIECLFHEVKERMGFEEPQCRTERAVERTTPFLLWTAGVTQAWFLAQNRADLIGWRPRWWSKARKTNAPPSFSEMLAALRRELLRGGLIHTSTSETQLRETLNTLVESAAYAA
jgi:hypothetical protein